MTHSPASAPALPPELDETHAPGLQSWVVSANDPACDFPVQNLPYGRFRTAGNPAWRIGVAIGDQVLDLQGALRQGQWDTAVAGLLQPLAAGDLNTFLARGTQARRLLRLALSQALRAGSAQQAALQPCLVPQAQAEMALPCRIGDYTDFYTGIHHATAVGKLFRPDAPLLPNYKWLPIGYHGRASSIGVSGQPARRPWGQLKGEASTPEFAPCRRLDYELELGAFIASGNSQGRPLSMAEAEDALAGVVLLNDWSARDMQAWEYQPLGPFLAKSFASTISPWLVTLEALAPFRLPFERPAGDPAPLPYLDSAANRARGSFNITLEVWLRSAAMRGRAEAAVRLSRANFRDAYWTLAQMVTHHASNGCNLQPGDLLGTGTLSGPQAGQEGSLLEQTQGGREPITLPDGSLRRFLEDGDEVTFRAFCEAHAGARRIGLGECTGTVQAAIEAAHWATR